MIIEDETEFCGEDLLHSVLQCKVRLCGWDWGWKLLWGAVWGFSRSFESVVGAEFS